MSLLQDGVYQCKRCGRPADKDDIEYYNGLCAMCDSEENEDHLLQWDREKIDSFITPKFATCECGGILFFEYTCQGWKNEKGQVMSCIPCDSAIRLSCRACGYWYQEPNNGSKKGMGNRPEWWDVLSERYL